MWPPRLSAHAGSRAVQVSDFWLVISTCKRVNLRQTDILAELHSAGRLTPADLTAAFPVRKRWTLQRELKALDVNGLAADGPRPWLLAWEAVTGCDIEL